MAQARVKATDLVSEAASSGRLRGKSDRVERLYALLEERMTRKQSGWGAGLAVLDGPETVRLPLVLRRSRAFRKALLEMPIAIEEDDLIVGNTLQDGVVVKPQMPKYATAEETDQAGQEGAKIEAGLAHKTPYYADIMEKGLSGVIVEIDRKLVGIAAWPASAEREEKLAFFGAMRIECESVIALAHRYAELAEEMAVKAGGPQRRVELHKIAEVCRRVPEFAPRTFHETVQAFWFVHYAFFSTQTLLSCGRLDQYLYPLLKRELDAGAITMEEAQELVDCLWLRFNDRAQIVRENFHEDNQPWEWEAGHRKRYHYARDAADAINHWGQNILLSGIRPDGSDGTNELTYLCLNALEKFALTSPVVTVRLHKGSPKELIHRSGEVLKVGGGMPYVNNDDVLVKAYVDLGVPVEDARDYVNSNCWETMIEGKSDQELVRGFNMPLYLELALNRGYSPVYRQQMGPDTGDPRQFKTFQEMMDAWKAQTDHQLQQGIDHIGGRWENGTLEHSSHGRYCFNPFLSAVTKDCIEREKDLIRGGARYVIWHVMGEGVANAIDALAAVKKLVFDEKSVTMDELLTALKEDWKGHENLRRRFVARAPKFANANDYADTIGEEMLRFFTERARFHAQRHPSVIFPCSVGTFSWYILIGQEVGATPDGRRAKDAVAGNLSPAPGADISGPTSAINSYLKMHVDDMAAGAPIDLRLSRSSLKGEEGTRRLAGLIKAFVDMGGNMLTLTVTDVEELKRAMVEPEKYRHLRVRMGGWSAYFVMLNKEQQILHIKKVEHGLDR